MIVTAQLLILAPMFGMLKLAHPISVLKQRHPVICQVRLEERRGKPYQPNSVRH